MIVVIHVLPAEVLARLPGQQFHLLVRPRAVIVLLLRQPLVYVLMQQDVGGIRPRKTGENRSEKWAISLRGIISEGVRCAGRPSFTAGYLLCAEKPLQFSIRFALPKWP
jgi:hypothetical protein